MNQNRQWDESDEAILRAFGRKPMSVFYRGARSLRKPHCNSFRPAHETQAIIEAQRHRKQKPK